MPSGITAFGTHIPYWRLTGETVSDALGAGPKKNARCVAGFDEDTTTMALEAARAALAETDRSRIASLTLATGSPTYGAKTNATAVHAALGLPATTSAMDVGGAERSGLAALINAMRLPGDNLVVLSDVGVGPAGSSDEVGLGDGAAAFVVGTEDGGAPAVELLARASVTEEFLDRWKAPGEAFASTWEERFGQDIYHRLGVESAAAALAQAGLEAGQISAHVCTGLSARAVRSVVRAVGAAGVAAEDLTSRIGRLGVAHAGVALIDAIESAQGGDVIALTLLADGAETLILRVTDTGGAGQAVNVRAQVAAGNDGLRYTDFLNWKGLLEKLGPRRPAPSRATAPPSHRELSWKFGFRADVCTSCGTRNLPPQRVCLRCGAVDAMEQVAMADVPGTIATFTIDHLAFSPAPPVIGVVIDFDGGGRFQCQLTDADPDQVAIGQRVIMTFRVMSEAAGISNYFWKARPLLGADETPAPIGRDGK
ncbi:OB-fold domain-containing protein [Brevibacterium atlanticum]|uniref:OB-fold domain-containing protein n=1 Tax=Brevibacterium atlanticum TaxID=2697563 RepID=UPI001AA0DAA8|nr:OB-fold domain-containing protein [Brevibacterium atlanticum]